MCGANLHSLNLCAILDGCHLVGSILGSDWFGVLILREGFVDIAGHVAINVSLCIVPGELHATKKRTHQVNCNGVMFLQRINEVVHVMHVGNFDAEVIYQ